jgi:hypothetical protein
METGAPAEGSLRRPRSGHQHSSGPLLPLPLSKHPYPNRCSYLYDLYSWKSSKWTPLYRTSPQSDSFLAATDALSYNLIPLLIQSSKRRICLDPEDVRFEDCQLYTARCIAPLLWNHVQGGTVYHFLINLCDETVMDHFLSQDEVLS